MDTFEWVKLMKTKPVPIFTMSRTQQKKKEWEQKLKDKDGKQALVRKRQKVRYLQNNIIAYQDQAWGDGQILINYRCSPGVEADRYQTGQNFHVLPQVPESVFRQDLSIRTHVLRLR